MSPSTKTWIYGALIAGSAALYVPRLFGGGDERELPPDIAAEAGAEELAGFTFDSDIEGPGSAYPDEPADTAWEPDGALQASTAATTQPTREQPSGDLQTALRRLDNFVARPGDPSLDALALDGSSGSTSAQSAHVVTSQGGVAQGESADLARARALARAEIFLAEHPVRGILRAQRGEMALLGDRIVSVGDRLVACDAQVTAIERNGVRLSCQGVELFAELPPLRAARSKPDESEQELFGEDGL